MATNMYASSVDPSKTKANLFDQAKKRAFGLGAALILAGAGSSTQHPIGSGTVSRVYGRLARGPLGIYNFAGDLGKAALPGVTSLLLIVFSWHAALWVIAGLGLAVASLIAILLPNISRTSPSVRERFFPSFTDCSAT
jgi:MFS transporter, FSR family, fosmidomycin resistance protein